MLISHFEIAFNVFNHRRDRFLGRFPAITPIQIDTYGGEGFFFAIFTHKAAKNSLDNISPQDPKDGRLYFLKISLLNQIVKAKIHTNY